MMSHKTWNIHFKCLQTLKLFLGTHWKLICKHRVYYKMLPMFGICVMVKLHGIPGIWSSSVTNAAVEILKNLDYKDDPSPIWTYHPGTFDFFQQKPFPVDLPAWCGETWYSPLFHCNFQKIRSNPVQSPGGPASQSRGSPANTSAFASGLGWRGPHGDQYIFGYVGFPWPWGYPPKWVFYNGNSEIPSINGWWLGVRLFQETFISFVWYPQCQTTNHNLTIVWCLIAKMVSKPVSL